MLIALRALKRVNKENKPSELGADFLAHFFAVIAKIRLSNLIE